MKTYLPCVAMLGTVLAWPATGVEPPSDYTSAMSKPDLLPEYDPAGAPPAPTIPMAESASIDEGGLRRCVGNDGVIIFTDRRCHDLDAADARLPVPAVRNVVALRVRSCARNQDDLLDGVRAALENHDANRLADFYHWSGMGTVEGYRLMDRLGSFSARPIVDVQLVTEAQAPAITDADSTPDPDFGNLNPLLEVPPPPAPRPHAARLLRVDQMRSDRDAASQVTYFHLLTNAGCWWMQF